MLKCVIYLKCLVSKVISLSRLQVKPTIPLRKAVGISERNVKGGTRNGRFEGASRVLRGASPVTNFPQCAVAYQKNSEHFFARRWLHKRGLLSLVRREEVREDVCFRDESKIVVEDKART